MILIYTPYAERKETGSDKRENEASLAFCLLVLEICYLWLCK